MFFLILSRKVKFIIFNVLWNLLIIFPTKDGWNFLRLFFPFSRKTLVTDTFPLTADCLFCIYTHKRNRFV